MKGCFILQRNFAYIGHAIAINLKKNHGMTDFCGYVSVRTGYEFLKNQNDIEYRSLLLDEDIFKGYKKEKIDYKYLEKLEKEYGIPNLWPFIAVDRIVMLNQLIREYPYAKSNFTHDDMLKLLQVYSRAIIEMLDKEKPDYLVASVVGSLGTSLLYYIAQKRGVNIIMIAPTATVTNQFTISKSYDSFTEAEEIMRRINAGQKSEKLLEVKKFLDDFRNQPKSYASHIAPMLKQTNRFYQLKFIRPQNIFKSIIAFFVTIYNYISNFNNRDYTNVDNPWYYFVDKAKRKIRNLIGVSDLCDTFDENEKFVFFPLHYEPEVTLMQMAPFYQDQIHLLKQIARSLPVAYKLYVKEHPAMVEYRTRKFYKELKKIPNVKIINPSVSSFAIIPRAKLIAVITGAVAWEAVLFKKPVVSFGNQFFNSLSAVKKCTEIEKLPYIIRDLIENFVYNENEVVNFLAGIFESSVIVNLNKLWYDEKDIDKKVLGLKELSALIANKLNKIKQSQ